MFFSIVNFLRISAITLGLYSILITSTYATNNNITDSELTIKKQAKITHFFAQSKAMKDSISSQHEVLPLVKVTTPIERKRSLPFTDKLSPAKKQKVTETYIPLQQSKNFKGLTSNTSFNHQPIQEWPKPLSSNKGSFYSANQAQRVKEAEAEMEICFLRGTNQHIQAYVDLINKAENHLIIASWNVNFIPEGIFLALMKAKKRGIFINFVANSIKRKSTLDYFENEEGDETTFQLFETKSHAKFLFVDAKSLILGSFNALGEAPEENDDASFMLKGTIKQLWPFYMSIYESYTSIGEDLKSLFDGIATISKCRNPGERPLLRRSFSDGTYIYLLRTIKEHEDFLKLATPYNGNVTIYSPFSTKDNTLKRLQKLESILPVGTKVNLKVLKQFEGGLLRLLSLVPQLESHAHVEVATSHQKIVVLGNQIICAGSLNWLSAAQDTKDPYSNVEFSIVLQGPKAEKIIESHYHY
jgi:hypothetical protein